jgi:hypothetical protein
LGLAWATVKKEKNVLYTTRILGLVLNYGNKVTEIPQYGISILSIQINCLNLNIKLQKPVSARNSKWQEKSQS